MTGRLRIVVICLFILFIGFTASVVLCDVGIVGTVRCSVGYSHINSFMYYKFPYNRLFCRISDILGYAAIILAGVLSVKGAMYVLKNGVSTLHPRIAYLFAMYTVVVGLYFLFDKVVINYRPVIIDGELESSYPSSHVLLAVIVFCSAGFRLKPFFTGSPHTVDVFSIICYVLAALTVFFRMASGVHWFTDIIGAVLLGAAILHLYYYICLSCEESEEF